MSAPVPPPSPSGERRRVSARWKRTLVARPEASLATRRWRFLVATAVGVFALFGVLFVWLWFAPCWFLGGCAPITDLTRFQAEGSELLDVRGRPFGWLATVNRRVVPLDSLPPYVPQAFVAAEDRRFFQHHGVDWRRLLGAFWTNLRRGRVVEGGSTITMQLARNLFPERLSYRERSLRRKVLEIRIARQIERAFPKRKILELYLNHIYLGEGAYGIDAAAHEYFGKPASQLTLPEAALLAGLPVAPSEINPRENLAAALRRQDYVLAAMVAERMISPAQAVAARRTPVRLVRSGRDAPPWAGYFIDALRRELERRLGPRIYTAGLKIYTTLDIDAQRAAERELARQLDAIEAGIYGPFRGPRFPEARGNGEDATPYLQGAVVLLDARTGEVRALVGGRDFGDSPFNRATQARRQPGSAFKPFVFYVALERYRSPLQRVLDEPVRLTYAGRTWAPENFGGRYDGPITLREALVRSKNAATVRLAMDVGLEEIARTARAFGITSELPTVPSLALGAVEVRPLELVRAYAVFANLGYRVEPLFVRRIVDRHGHRLWQSEPELERVADPAVAFVLTTILQDVVDRGTGTLVRQYFRGTAAGKTGTTNDGADAWFVGYTPELVGGVWIGFDRRRTIVPEGTGGTLAAPVWGRLMARVYAGRRVPGWAMPPGVVQVRVDAVTGLVVDPPCPATGRVVSEYLLFEPPAAAGCPVGIALAPDTGLGPAWEVPPDTSARIEPPPPGLRSQHEVAPGVYWPELAERRRRGSDTPRVEPLPRRPVVPAASTRDTATAPGPRPDTSSPPDTGRTARNASRRGPQPPSTRAS